MNNDMNNNYNNEQELMLQKKIEKREKTDTIIAYVLIIVLLVCIVFVLYLKFIREEEDPIIDEYTPTYIGISDISTSLNSSTLANNYISDGASLVSSVSSNAIIVTYTKDDVNVNLNIPVIGNELEVTVTDDNKDIITDIYKEITSIICVYYGNDENSCHTSINNIDTNSSVNGIRYVNTENSYIVYIDMNRSIDVNTIIEDNTDTLDKVSITETNYTVSLLDIEISNINVTTSDNSISLNGNISRLTEDTSAFDVVVRLYDINGLLLKENTTTYNEGDVLDDNSFVVDVTSDTFNISDVEKYSIEITK